MTGANEEGRSNRGNPKFELPTCLDPAVPVHHVDNPHLYNSDRTPPPPLPPSNTFFPSTPKTTVQNGPYPPSHLNPGIPAEVADSNASSNSRLNSSSAIGTSNSPTRLELARTRLTHHARISSRSGVQSVLGLWVRSRL